MRYRINQIKIELWESLDLIPEKIAKSLSRKVKNLSASDIKDVEIVKRSIDSRGVRAKDGRTGHVIKVLTVDFTCEKKLPLPEAINTEYYIPYFFDTENGDLSEACARPVVIGFGPCGMFASLVLARAGLKPIVLERGLDVDSRIEKVKAFWENGKLDPECNVQFGEGGAGTFSDGKLNTGIKDPRARFVLETFVKAGADPDILIDGRPHIGTDDLRNIVKNIRRETIALGGEVRFGARVERLEPGTHSIRVIYSEIVADRSEAKEKTIETDYVVLAIGHSARDTVRALYNEGFLMEPKSFSMGVRVEHPQELIDKGVYGTDAGHPELPPAYYKLSTKASDGRGVYSFCMCPGGEIVNAASQEGGVVTNGMSNHDRDSGFANSGILVDVRPEDYGVILNDVRPEDYGVRPNDVDAAESATPHPSCDETEMPDVLKGIAFQEKYERLAFEKGGSNYALPTTTWARFNASTEATTDEDPVGTCLPDFVASGIREAIPVFGKMIKGFDNPDTVIKGIESRSSSPVRIKRNPSTLEGFIGEDSVLSGFYPGGEGAGYAGGITSAACDGIKIAEKILQAISSRFCR